MWHVWLGLALLTFPLLARPLPEVELTPPEQREILERTLRFRNPRDTAVLNLNAPHYGLNGQPVGSPPRRAHPPSTESTWEFVQTKDWLPRLTDSWVSEAQLLWDPTYVPSEGRILKSPWSGDYWALLKGGTSYRYAEHRDFASYDQAISSYTQPAQWKGLLREPIELWSELVRQWSPAEKWDLTVGDTEFNLTREEKKAGTTFRDERGNVPAWMGFCNGWAAASLMVAKPTRAVEVVGAQGVRVRWLPDELKAMVALAWAKGTLASNYVGGRCDARDMETYPNGRLKQPECFDANPSTFYLALANLVGRHGTSFLMDSAFDQQVWNYPIVAYSFRYFNPLYPQQTSDFWADVAVDYDGYFRANDRFQSPLTRGIRDASGKYDDRLISKIVGVAATVAYVASNQPSDSLIASPDQVRRTTYTFDLELQRHRQGYWALGGEWHQNGHPDFLWVPKSGSSPVSSLDEAPGYFSGLEAPSGDLTVAALEASKQGYPLCRVLKRLIDASSGTNTYKCPRG